MKETLMIFGIVSVSLFLVLTGLTFTVYEVRAAVLVLFVLWTLTSLLALLGFIPLLGQIAYWFIADQFLFPIFFHVFADIEPTWLTDVIFWLGFIYTLGFTNFSLSALQRDKAPDSE